MFLIYWAETMPNPFVLTNKICLNQTTLKFEEKSLNHMYLESWLNPSIFVAANKQGWLKENQGFAALKAIYQCSSGTKQTTRLIHCVWDGVTEKFTYKMDNYLNS